MSVNDTITNDKGAQLGPIGTILQQIDNIVREMAYFRLNRPGWNVAAAAVAPPVLARATTASTVKTTATTELLVNGVKISLTATDPIMVNANIAAEDPNTLAAGSVRRWWITWDGTNATTVVRVRPSNDKVIATYGTAALALAACRWPALPPIAETIIGIVDITNTTNPFIPGTTLFSAAGVTDAYHDGPDANSGIASLIAP